MSPTSEAGALTPRTGPDSAGRAVSPTSEAGALTPRAGP